MVSCHASENHNEENAKMKKTMPALALAAALFACGQDPARVVIKSKDDVAALAAIPEWRRGADTNGVTIAVQSGTAECGIFGGIPFVRVLTFDAEGRLVRVSPPALSSGQPLEKTLLDALDVTRVIRREVPATSKSPRTPGQPTIPRQSATPRADGR